MITINSRAIFLLIIGCFLLTIIYYYHSSNFFKSFSKAESLSYLLTMGNKQATNKSYNCKELSVLTWNVWFGSQGGWDHPEERWEQLLNISLQENPDIIGFQECTQPFLKVVSGFPNFNEIYVQVNEKPVYSRYFVMIYMKKNLKTLKKETITLKTTLDRRCEVATFQKEDAEFRLATVHIESYVTSPDIREIQMQTIFDYLMTKEDSIQLSLLVGDSNFDDDSKEYEFVKKSPFQDAWPTVNKGEAGYSFETTKNLMNKRNMQIAGEGPCECRLDRILFRTPPGSVWVPVECRLIGTEPLKKTITGQNGSQIPLFPSDHFGLVAKFCNQNKH